MQDIIWSIANASVTTGMGQLYFNNFVQGNHAVINCRATWHTRARRRPKYAKGCFI